MLESLLPKIRRRLRLASGLNFAVLGCTVGCAIWLLLTIAVAAGWADLSVPQWLVVAVLQIGGASIIAAGAGYLRRGSDQLAAAIVDDRYQLKDRATSALQFGGDDDVMRRLQRSEADGHLREVDPVRCVPIQIKRAPVRVAATLALVAAVVMAIHLSTAPTLVARQTLPVAASQAAGLQAEMIPELEKLAEDTEDPEIEKLLEELRDKVERLQSEPVDQADLLVQLSDMQTALAEARAAMQIELTDEMLASLATAIEPAESMQGASEALKDQDYDKASEELQSVDPESLSDKERRAVSDNLKRMVASMTPGKPGSLSANLASLAKNLEDSQMGECKKCLSKIGKQCEKQSQCKKCGQCLSKQISLLAQCKCQCRGQCDSPFAKKSNSPSTSVGSAASNEPLGGDSTRLDSGRVRDDITGMMGDRGDSETQILQSPEAQQGAARGYTKKYRDYRRQAEEVLESEPLPQSHRQTVRSYFEAIRPDEQSDDF